VVVITPIPLEQALPTHSAKEPSARTLRTRQLEQDADAVVQAVKDRGAAAITVDEKQDSASHYLSGLRSALARGGHVEILLQKRRGLPQIVAWTARPEDAARIEIRRETGARLGQFAKQRAAAKRGPQATLARRNGR
jgi:hypothetical protein